MIEQVPESIKNLMNADEIFNALMKEHRTHQATYIRTLAKVLEKYSKTTGDLRNQAAIDYAKNATKANKTNPIPYI